LKVVKIELAGPGTGKEGPAGRILRM
jgi:hypothetical protein